MMTATNKLIEEFGNESRWVNWNLVNKDGKNTKVPIGSSTDPNTWKTFDNLPYKDRVGIIFTPDKKLLGIDIDHCLIDGKVDHPLADEINEFIKSANTYTEVSPSGDGLHMFLKISNDEGLTLHSNKKAPYELYTTGRYFTFTGNTKSKKGVRTVTVKEAMEILSTTGYGITWGVDKEQNRQTTTVKTIKHQSLEDQEVLDKMFQAKNGKEIEQLYNGDTSKYNNDDSNADMALLSHLAFWTGRDNHQMERIWLASPIGQRAKTQQRQDYRDRSINHAIDNTTDVYTPREVLTDTVETVTVTENEDGEEIMDIIAVEMDLLYQDFGKGRIIYTVNTENMCRVLRKHPQFVGRFRYDTFKNVYEICDTDKWEVQPAPRTQWRMLDDIDAINVMTEISTMFEYFQKVTKGMVYDAIQLVCQENKYDSAVDYIKSIQWDGIPRLDNWLRYTYGVPDDEYHRAVASNWMKGMVKRLVYPGCKFDYVLVLEGEQGARKSTSLAVLGGDWHVETTMSTDNKDFFMQFAGKAIIEFSEGETLSRTEVKKMKAIITTQSDKYRPPYERVSKDFPRRCVFAMTTNQTEYLKDETGNRRWLPIRVELPQADTDWLRANRDQLFAETYQRVIVDEETIYEFPEEETKKQQDARMIQDPNTDRVAEWYYDQEDRLQYIDGLSTYEIHAGVFNGGFTGGRAMTKYEEMNLSNILHNGLGLEKRRVVRGNMRVYKWFNPKKNTEEETM